MVYRFALIIVLFVVLAVYIFRLAAQGKISGTFRAVSLILLCVLLGLSVLGYYSSRQQEMQSLQDTYSSQKESILQDIQELQQEQEFSRARKLAEKYLAGVQDPALEKLREKSRQAELEKILQQEDPGPRELLQIYQELSELTQEPRYSMLWQEQKQKIRQEKETRLLQHLEELPRQSLAQRLLAYRRLLQLSPEDNTYQQERDRLQQAIASRINSTHWSNVCDRESTDYCEHIGWLAFKAASGEQASSRTLGEVLGVTWRPRGTLISRDEERASENSYYYILFDWRENRVFLEQVDYVQPEKNLPD